MPYQSVVEVSVNIGSGGSQDASIDHLSAKYVPPPAHFESGFPLIMISITYLWQCDNSFVCLLV